MSVAVLFCCVNYLQLKAELTGKIKNVASLETEWSQLKEENDAYESQVTSETDLNQIKKIAIGRLGMTYPFDTLRVGYLFGRYFFLFLFLPLFPALVQVFQLE